MNMDSNVAGFLAGCVIIGLTTVIVVMIISFGEPGFAFPDDWETLVVGALAVLGAVFSIRQISKQIRQVDEHRQDELRRQSNSARAVLPLALTAICEYARKCIDQLLPATTMSVATLRTHVFSFPDIPPASIPLLRDCIRFSDGKIQQELTDLIIKIQPNRSNLVDFEASRQMRLPLNVDEHIVSCLEIYARSSSLFWYGRFEDERRFQTLEQAHFLCVGMVGQFPTVDQRVAQASARFTREIQSYGV